VHSPGQGAISGGSAARHLRGTIITSWLNPAAAERLYGGGLARRMLTDESVARVVTVGEAPRGGGSGAGGTRAP